VSVTALRKMIIEGSLVVALLVPMACTTDKPEEVDARGSAESTSRVKSFTLLHECSATPESIYVAPDDLATVDVERRGEVVRCTTDPLYRVDDLRSKLSEHGYESVDLKTDVQAYRIQYRTERLAGSASVGTAVVYLPVEPLANPSPLVLFAHGLRGSKLDAALSKQSLESDGHIRASLAIAARGYPVIAPDYNGYIEGARPPAPVLAEDEAHAVLDATRALAALLPERETTANWALVGASQGSHAVFSAQAYEKSYGAGGKLRAVFGLVPSWAPMRWQAHLLSKEVNLTTASSDDVLSMYLAMEYLRGHTAIYDGEAAVLSMFKPEKLPVLAGLNELTDFPKLGSISYDYFDNAFLDALMPCAATGRDEDCTGDVAKQWQPRFRADRPTLDPNGAEVLAFVAGRDELNSAGTTKCTLEKLEADLADSDEPLTICADPEATHDTLLRPRFSWMMSWLRSRLLGGAEPEACPGTAALGEAFAEQACTSPGGNVD
jgi:pimeloyl-ACP methyl ester carboxylesterase